MENYNSEVGEEQVSASIQRVLFSSNNTNNSVDWFQTAANSSAVKGELFPFSDDDEEMKSKIISHPLFSTLLHSYLECHKVGAPPEVAARMAATWHQFEATQLQSTSACVAPKDPELDQFMEAYSDMLKKYKEEVTRPVEEAMEFMRRIESQLTILTNPLFSSLKGPEGADSSSSEQGLNSEGEREVGEIDRGAEERELKDHLLRKYSGYLSTLKQELSKKKKVRKLPKEARQKLLTWWELHYKWPYPSETEKAALAETTGLDQKQINNWFINQRKRHWKPSEEMQFMVMEGIHSQPHPHPQSVGPSLYMEGQFMPNAPYRFGT